MCYHVYKQSLYKSNSFKNNYLFYVLMCQCKMNVTNAIQRRESGFGKCEQACMRFFNERFKNKYTFCKETMVICIAISRLN